MTERKNKIIAKALEFGAPHLSPIFKWTGGKRKEISHFELHFPDFILKKESYCYVEPFVGAGAVYWYLNNTSTCNVINDFDPLVMNFYSEFRKNNAMFSDYLDKISQITDHNELEKEYYSQRNKDKSDGLKKLSNQEKAIRFFVVNQLAFSGMRRFNSSGEFNVPFGHYKGLNTDIIGSDRHVDLLNRTELRTGDFEQVMMDNDNEKTFMFLDPPYTRVFKEYSANNDFNKNDHDRLSRTIRSMKKASVMLIIDSSEYTEKTYSDLIKSKYSLKYGVNIKNRFNTAVEHLIICNY